MNIQVKIGIPYLWEGNEFEKNEWGSVNYVVGPNGTGKTQFAEQLRKIFQQKGLKVRYLSAERMAGLEREAYNYFTHDQLRNGLNIGNFSDYKLYGAQYGLIADSWIIIKNKLDVRIRIEAVLAQMFKRQIRLAEEGGFLSPRIQTYGSSTEYGLKDKECQGLKELIGLLAFLYDDENNCIILDEPELHLHPQYQHFLLAEIKKLAGDPLLQRNKKCFVIITHSPFMLDIRTVQDLSNLIVFQSGHKPAWIGALEQDDSYRIQKMLPRLNTHHKQFFFANRPVFVEGYTDQQLFSLIQDVRERNLGAGGVSIIDVGGKEEVDAFFRLCARFNINACAIVDYDVLFDGKIRQTVSQLSAVKDFVQKEGLGVDLLNVVGEMTRHIYVLFSEIEKVMNEKIENDAEMMQFLEIFRRNTECKVRTKATYMAIQRNQKELAKLIPEKASEISIVAGKASKIEKAFAQAGVYILPNGELENCCPTYVGNPYSVSDSEKTNVFLQERDFILKNTDVLTLEERYKNLVPILDMACGTMSIDTTRFLNLTLGNWIHAVQSSIVLGEVKNIDELKANPRIQWNTYERIIDINSFSLMDKGKFSCSITLKTVVDTKARSATFDDKTVPSKFHLPA